LSQYYYTVSALPLLFYETEIQEDSVGLFIDFCSDWLTPADLRLLHQANYTTFRESSFDHPLLQKWQEWERGLRNALVELRASKKGEEPYRYSVDGEKVLGMDEISREAFTSESALAGEDLLNRARWDFLDELETGHHFDIEKLLVHYLKLQILERKGKFREEAGREKYSALFSALTDYDVHEAMAAG